MNQDYKKAAGNALGDFMRDDSGATAIEYGLIGAAVGLTLVAVMPAFSQATDDTYQRILGYLQTANS